MPPASEQPYAEIDVISARILRILAKNGRIPNPTAREVGLSPSACLRQVQYLERRGAIQEYRAVITPTPAPPASPPMSPSAFRATPTTRNAPLNGPALRRRSAECHNITGTVEYLLRVEVRDLEAYRRFHIEVLGAFPQIATITTHVVMGSPKDDRA